MIYRFKLKEKEEGKYLLVFNQQGKIIAEKRIEKDEDEIDTLVAVIKENENG